MSTGPLRPGVRLGVDVGSVRVGVARTDPEAILTIPVETIHRSDDGSDLRRLVDIARQFDVVEIVVGLPRHLGGGEGVSAGAARRFARRIARALPDVRVCLVDERLSSNQAHRRLRESGVPEREHRAMVDQVAAQIILEQALDDERMGTGIPGQTVEPRDRKGT
ncbi:MAG: Holliday junction resolvase RuvX [Actinomyces sp.]|nr:Holliday junction resolvase RuvX [Actinomyces sp.]MCI1641107.1 Holliday junction resolvase RuvX [Actinomyces sp.]MCI1662374.1 Holliday junction resolvase RuvX [Actinomyces sp.]MCI1691098.1 Holliday junction resolvase RuvX [Actinomyces sp.]MCI1787124.1 Holliday junction resolvase RuvX [Actinomyces sp.]MCI1829310.1 Holliday junction resolvase RuvX [Actinomyces sp.]